MTEPQAVDILVDAGDPAVLDADVQALPGCVAAVLGGTDNYRQHNGRWVVRCFSGAPALKSMGESQGYFTVVGELPELL